ncbi:polysaccharide biosynthesis protein [bacterium]|nr:polysaccharide biosynthesis protein [bacterium]
MDIQGTTVMVLGGGGMVGRAVCRELLKNRPARIVVCSLQEEESRLAIRTLQEEMERASQLTHDQQQVELVPEWGNLFARESLRHLTGNQAMQTPEGRAAIIEDTLTPMSAEVARRFYLYQIVLKYQPHVIIDAMNTATGIAYSDIFSHARQVWREVQDESTNKDSVEKLLCSLYIPQLIRHVDVLYRAMVAVDTKAYVKLGTSGTGGMGWNIPYTHGEERPSSVLLSKSAVAGAHTLLLFLLARTPGIASLENEAEVISKAPPATMEIKPTAMIGWRGIGFGEINKRGRPVELEEVSFSHAISAEAGTILRLDDPDFGKPSGKKLETVFVDTGENGLFSTEEFVAITSPGQMEFVTPEEIARNVVDEVRGVNTGKDVINALNVTCMGPTYRAGFQRQRAIQKLRELEGRHGVDSVAFENLGPPRLSKLLYEAYYLKRLFNDLQDVLKHTPQQLVEQIFGLLELNPDLLATPVSIGIPVLFEKDGKAQLLRGRQVKTPPPSGNNEVHLDSHSLEEWARAGWIDLRPANLELWQQRVRALVADSLSIPAADTSSRYVRDREFWRGDSDGSFSIQPGEIAAWIFINEDKGERGRE